MRSQDVLRQFIVEEIEGAPSASVLSDSYPLIVNHVIDSLGIYQLVGFIESHFGVEIDDEDLVPENFGSLAGMARLIEERTAG